MGHLARFLAQVQLQVHVGKVQMTESKVIAIARGFARTPRRVQHFDRLRVFPAQAVEVGDVVVGLRDQQRHVVLLANRARPLVGGEGARKIVEADQAHGHVAEHHGEALRVPVGHQSLVSSLVVRKGFFEAVLAVKNVAGIDFQARKAPGLVEPREDVSGAPPRGGGPVVLSHEDERLDGTAQGARCFLPVLKRLVDLNGPLVVRDGRPIVTARVERIGHGAEAERNGLFSAEPPGN